VTITAVGPTNTSAVSGPDGSYSLKLLAGIYQFNAAKTGYEPASTVDFAIVAGTSNPLNVTLTAVTLSSLREIGRVSVTRGRSQFNASPASIATVSQQTFIDQGQLQLQRVIDQTPGIVNDHPGTSVNNADPFNIVFPSIRDGLGFETATLVDGHPVAVQDFGDFVTTFFLSDVLQNIEVDKGPGAMPSTINYSINGTVNIRTLDPTATQTGQIKLGYDSDGGTNGNIRYSNTFFKKLGILVDYAQYGTPGPLYNAGSNQLISTSALLFCPATGSAANAATCQTINATAGGLTHGIAGTSVSAINAPTIATTTLVGCCFNVNTNGYDRTELAKLRFNFSSATVATLTYLGEQSYADQNGNHVYNYATIFCPSGITASALAAGPLAGGTGAGGVTPSTCSNTASGVTYNGSVYTAGQAVNTWQNVFPPNDFEIDNEPIMEGEIRTTVGHDTLLGRYYTASINRLQYELTGPATTNPNYNAYETYTLNGLAYLCPAGYSNSGANCAKSGSPTIAPTLTPFNNQPVTIQYGDAAFTSPEEDHVHGGTIEYDHFLGSSGSVISAIFDQMSDTSDSLSWSGAPTSCVPSTVAGLTNFCAVNPNIPTTSSAAFMSANGGGVSATVYGGSAVRYSTYLLRGIFQLTPQINLSLANYYDNYYTKFSQDGGYTYTSSSFNYDAPRAALEIRVNPNIAIRASAGASIAPAYLNLLEGKSLSQPSYSTTTGYATNTVNNPNIKPETGFEEDLGGDFRISNDGLTVLSLDGYVNHVHNQFVSSSFTNGTITVCNQSGGTIPAFQSPNGNCGANGTVNPTLISTYNTNLDQVLFSGLELKISRDPTVGFGFVASGSLMRAYPYNVPCNLYYTGAAALTCTGIPSTNLAILNGDNFLNSATAGVGSYNSVSNHSEPYSQAYLEAHWRTPRGGLALFDLTYYGPNNSLNVPAFWYGNAALRLPIHGSNNTFVQVALENVFNAYANPFETEYAGVAVPLYNGQVGLTNQNTNGPRTAYFTLVHNFGGGY
jgi:hypothetical protein